MGVQQLIESLVDLDLVHQKMIESAENKRQAIVKNDVNALITIMNQESRLLKQVEQLEETRQEACYQFLLERGVKSRLNLSVSELVRLVFDPDEKTRLLQIQKQLSETLQILKERNDLNQQLAEQSLSFIDFSLDLLSAAPAQEATYQHPAARSLNGRRPGMFDTRA